MVSQAEVYWFHKSKVSPFIWSAVLSVIGQNKLSCDWSE